MRPIFRVVCSDLPNDPIQAWTPSDAWRQVIDRVNSARQQAAQSHPDLPFSSLSRVRHTVDGNFQTGLAHPSIIKNFEALPGARLLRNYTFKYDLILKLPIKTVRAVVCA
jgi:hypothetical protein